MLALISLSLYVTLAGVFYALCVKRAPLVEAEMAHETEVVHLFPVSVDARRAA